MKKLIERLKTWWIGAVWPVSESFKRNLTCEQARALSNYGEPSLHYALERKAIRINELILNKIQMGGEEEEELILHIPKYKKDLYEMLRKVFIQKGYDAFYDTLTSKPDKQFLVISWEKKEEKEA